MNKNEKAKPAPALPPGVQQPQAPMPRTAIQKVVSAANTIEAMRATNNSCIEFYSLNLGEALSAQQQAEVVLQQLGAQIQKLTKENAELTKKNAELKVQLGTAEQEEPSPTPEQEPEQELDTATN